MFGDLDKYILVFLTGLVVSYLLTPVVKKLAFRFGVVDMPNARRPHQRPTARGGGAGVFIAVQIACLVAFSLTWPRHENDLDFAWWERFVGASLILFIVGIIDDVRGMKPWVKLGGQTLAALIMALTGTRFGSIWGYTLPVPIDCLLVVIWLVAIINAFNLIDGLDGLASGLAIISAVGLCGILLMQQRVGAVLVLLGFMGACLGFLRYNFHPASIFLGDTGSMFIGFTLGVISLQTLTKNSFLVSFTIPLLVLGVPIYDAVLAIWRRAIRKWIHDKTTLGVKRGIMQPDLEHLHHRLKFGGLSTGRVAMTLYIINGALVIVGLSISLFQPNAAGIFLIALLAGVYVLMRHLAVIELRETGRAFLIGLRRPTHSTMKALLYPVWDMLWLSGSLALIMWVVENRRVDFWHNWFLDLPVWVTPTFSLLAISRTYVTYWPRARLRDIISLACWLETGILLSLGLALVMDPSDTRQWILRAVLVAAISHPVIILSRVIYRCAEELALWIRKHDPAVAPEKILLYGAGTRGQLFLKDLATRNSKTPDQRVIVGFIDDENALHYQWIYGHLVLGGIKELPHLITKWKINRMIVVADLLPESWKNVREIAIREGVHLSEWIPQEHEINLTKAKKADIVEALHKSS